MVITAEEVALKLDSEFYKENGYYLSVTEPIIFACKVALVYAELHRKECLKQASEKARKQHVCTGGASYYIVNKDSILNAYSKKNIR
jgi:neutral trehalase